MHCDLLGYSIGCPISDDEWTAFCCFDRSDRTEEQKQALERVRQGVQKNA